MESKMSVLLAFVLRGFLLVQGEVPEIELALGRLRGVKEFSTEGREFYSFMGVPYAQPPTGVLRFKDPVPVVPWNGVLNASKMAAVCPQYKIEDLLSFSSTPQVSGDEDCLYLNVFTHQLSDFDALLPVMVYIHGGGYRAGSVAEYLPHALLNEDIVLVLMNYRLGTLGFLSTEDDVIPGNFGLKDQLLALQWVQEHIRHFGGDPGKVTLFGESAGGASVHLQILSPLSDGLFSRAILHSGTALSPWALGGTHKALAVAIGQAFNCSSDDGTSDELLECLQQVPAYDLVHTLLIYPVVIAFPLLFGPRVDGVFLPDSPMELVKAGRYQQVDLISGVTRDEGAYYTHLLYRNKATLDKLNEEFEETAPHSIEIRDKGSDVIEKTSAIFQEYVGGSKLDYSSVEGLTRLFSHRHFHLGHDATAAFHIKNNDLDRKVYMFEFNYRGNLSLCDNFENKFGKDWISHVDDLYYLFTGGPLFGMLRSRDDLKVRKLMTKMWTNFAKYGNPTPDDSLGFIWTPATLESFNHLSVAKEPEMKMDVRREVRKFWEKLSLNNTLIPDLNELAKLNASKRNEL